MRELDFYALILVLAPFFAALSVGMTISWINDKAAQFITCGLAVLSAFFAWSLFVPIATGDSLVHIKLFNWFAIKDFKASWSIYIDPLTSVMLIVITSVSALVHIYSVGYMNHDKHKPRFMAYISLFTFCMIMLVTADNLVQVFFGWEGVGLSSYLLIGFWFHKDSASNAAMKAFLVNRVGDLGFALGIFLTFITFRSVDFANIFERVTSAQDLVIPILGYEVSTITVICLLLFIGCMGKSAQLGLHTWLPDAMEGPTPVSALIHAATMVTAGVFFTARLSHIFEYSETALSVIAVVGAVTCIFAASVALVQNDIKRVIAYSTCSQLGYMFFASGCSAYAAAVFHLMTHACFKALLFLGAGSVIHAMSDEQDIRKMGGIWKKIPFTYVMMWIGSLALAGIPPFAGFYSKDIILEAVFASNNPAGRFAFWLGITATTLTAFYSWRLLIMVFHGKTRANDQVISHVHESSFFMTIPLFLLALGAVFSGYIGAYHLDMVSGGGEFWRDSIFVLERNNSLKQAYHVDIIIKLLPLIVGVFGIALAYFLYQFRIEIPARISTYFQKLYRFLYNKWYFDEIYHLLFVKNMRFIGEKFWRVLDIKIIDGMPNGAAYLSERGAAFLAKIQTGYIYHYALVIMIGIVVLLTWSLMGV